MRRVTCCHPLFLYAQRGEPPVYTDGPFELIAKSHATFATS
jgi:hypothetical protein